ncbi:MAG: type II secretion system GspH family protein [Ruminococcus sp.]|nr:type II secretion system GspH family protein [Ruminococcus sp.]
MRKNKSGMTLVEVVVSMAILALTVAIAFSAISFSLKILDRGDEVSSEYKSALEDMVTKLDDTSSNDKSVLVSIDGDEQGKITLNKVKTDADSDSIIGSFYYYAIK